MGGRGGAEVEREDNLVRLKERIIWSQKFRDNTVIMANF